MFSFSKNIDEQILCTDIIKNFHTKQNSLLRKRVDEYISLKFQFRELSVKINFQTSSKLCPRDLDSIWWHEKITDQNPTYETIFKTMCKSRTSFKHTGLELVCQLYINRLTNLDLSLVAPPEKITKVVRCLKNGFHPNFFP